MDAKYFKILTFLYDKGVGEFVNISPALLDLYPNVDRMDGFIVQHESQKVNGLLISMQKGELIEFRQYSIGGGNNTNGYSWLDTVQIQASITQKGKDAIDSEIAKGETARLIESTILTNESVRETNTATVQNLHFQKKAQIWTIALGGLSTLFILTTIIQSAFDKTEQRLKDIQETMQIQSQKTQKLDSSLQEIKTSIQTKRIDTVFVRH